MSISHKIGWGITLIGAVFYFYGYFWPGSPPIIAWSSVAPDWISGFFPNFETELGTALMLVGSIPLCRPHSE